MSHRDPHVKDSIDTERTGHKGGQGVSYWWDISYLHHPDKKSTVKTTTTGRNPMLEYLCSTQPRNTWNRESLQPSPFPSMFSRTSVISPVYGINPTLESLLVITFITRTDKERLVLWKRLHSVTKFYTSQSKENTIVTKRVYIISFEIPFRNGRIP